MTTIQISGYTLEVDRDDRGKLVAELWDRETGSTVGIEEVKTLEMARRWACELVNSLPK